MSPSNTSNTSWELYRHLAEIHERGSPEAGLVVLLSHLLTEVEALREALSSPETPEAVRQSYRQAYERIAVLSHNSAGPSGGVEKIIRRFVPDKTHTDRFAPELKMMERLGATKQEQQALREEMEKVEMYT
ncbi:hypothetical protein [Hyalangium minutum]|uniref:Uncharacterized protein n=1 Tax=Hyalangium minutum TaxID=394096 RepID=A0A085WEW3_9BACT|nr:hypothetical protein [Hyalangium minutum]KFE66226.1 hypothetical protein DB31_1291 [Hyalangium minutum]